LFHVCFVVSTVFERSPHHNFNAVTVLRVQLCKLKPLAKQHNSRPIAMQQLPALAANLPNDAPTSSDLLGKNIPFLQSNKRFAGNFFFTKSPAKKLKPKITS